MIDHVTTSARRTRHSTTCVLYNAAARAQSSSRCSLYLDYDTKQSRIVVRLVSADTKTSSTLYFDHDDDNASAYVALMSSTNVKLHTSRRYNRFADMQS